MLNDVSGNSSFVDEVKRIMKQYGGWTYTPRNRKGHTYIYAQRKVEQRRQERYVAPLASLETMHEKALVSKLS